MQDIHGDLLQAMAEMAAVTQAPAPVQERYTGARWRLSKVSSARRALWDELYPKIYARADPQQALALAALNKSNIELRRLSSAHINRWSTAAVEADWEGYCEASRIIRWRMMSVVRHERRHVLPMLSQLSQV
jgi:hypothetical protein